MTVASDRFSRLEIRGLLAQVRLGVTPEERAVPQEVEFDFRIAFEREPRGTRTDRIEDTLCYGALCDALQQLARAREYQLIEFLGRAAYERLKELTGPGHAVELTVHKLKPPVEHLRGGARFTYGERVPS